MSRSPESRRRDGASPRRAARRLRIGGAHDALDLRRGTLLEAVRALPGEQLVQHRAERVDVRGRGHALAAHLFRRGVLRRHHAPVRERRFRIRGALVAEQLRDAEVQQLHDAGIGDEDVRGLEVAVHEQILVRVHDRAEHLLHERETGGHAELEVVAVAIERPSRDVLHGEPWQSRVGDAAIEQARDARMRERREDAPLLEEAANEQRVVLAAAANQLERRRLRELPVRALGEEDLAHARPRRAPARDATRPPYRQAARADRSSSSSSIINGPATSAIDRSSGPFGSSPATSIRSTRVRNSWSAPHARARNAPRSAFGRSSACSRIGSIRSQALRSAFVTRARRPARQRAILWL